MWSLAMSLPSISQGATMAFYKWAFEKVGGFDPEFRKAGDEFCWRLQQEGQIIGFSPSAIVWHHRRFTLGAFRKQQNGYGEAKALLRFKHLIFFGHDVQFFGLIRDGCVDLAHEERASVPGNTSVVARLIQAGIERTKLLLAG